MEDSLRLGRVAAGVSMIWLSGIAGLLVAVAWVGSDQKSVGEVRRQTGSEILLQVWCTPEKTYGFDSPNGCVGTNSPARRYYLSVPRSFLDAVLYTASACGTEKDVTVKQTRSVLPVFAFLSCGAAFVLLAAGLRLGRGA